MNKYRLTDETIEVCGHTLYRIVCVNGFASVEVGDKGGYIESEDNLSQHGNCWIYDIAEVYGNARVYGDAEVYGDARVYGNARIYDHAQIYDNAQIYGNARIYGNAWIYGDACVYGNAEVHGDAQIYGNAWIYDHAQIGGDAQIYDHAEVYGNAQIYDHAEVYGNAQIFDHAQIGGDANIRADEDYIVLKNYWSSGRYFTWTRSNDRWRVGCFYGTGEELIKRAYQDGEKSGKHYEAYVRFVEQLKQLDK